MALGKCEVTAKASPQPDFGTSKRVRKGRRENLESARNVLRSYRIHALAPQRNSCARAPQFPSRPLTKGQETFTSPLASERDDWICQRSGTPRGSRPEGHPRRPAGGYQRQATETGITEVGVGAPGRLQASTGRAPRRAAPNKAGQAAASRARVQR